jgi:histidinol dehydrogenase
MKVWHLEREWDAFLDSVIGNREKRKGHAREAAQAIRREVLEGGDDALVSLGKRFDGWQKDYPLRIDDTEIREAAEKIDKKDLPVLRGMIRNVRSYHRAQGIRGRTYKRKGLRVEEEFVPVERALVYVPGGQVPYPSSLVMGAVPAQIAGVKELYVTTPTHDGVLNPYIAACAVLLGIRDVYRLGGAQAIYAFALGIGSTPKADMIVGPGNAYVEEAKRDVYGQVGIDMLAGPSELAILMERLLAQNARRGTVEKALQANGFLVHYASLDKAVEAINRIAPEHLEVIGDESIARNIQYPGIIYVGKETCVSMGDYYIGTNHVLPTGGAGRFSGGLSVDRFTKRKVLVKIDRSFLQAYGDSAIRLAEIEGLYAHGEAIRARKELLR